MKVTGLTTHVNPPAPTDQPAGARRRPTTYMPHTVTARNLAIGPIIPQECLPSRGGAPPLVHVPGLTPTLWLEREDIIACLVYAGRVVGRERVDPHPVPRGG